MQNLDNETARLLRYYMDLAEAQEKALIRIAEIIPEDAHDWQIHGDYASDRFMRINTEIVSLFKSKRDCKKENFALVV